MVQLTKCTISGGWGQISQPSSKVMRFSSVHLRNHSQDGEMTHLIKSWGPHHGCGWSFQGDKSGTDMRAMMSRLCAELTPEGRGTDGPWGRVWSRRNGDLVKMGRQGKECQRSSRERVDDVIKEASFRVGYTTDRTQYISYCSTSCCPPAVRLWLSLMS